MMIIVPKYFQLSWNVLCVVITKLGYYGKTSKGSQRYHCCECLQTFPAECCANTDTFDTLYYRRKIQPVSLCIYIIA
ncbi:MAG: hypothetical protein F6K39_42930 [Okeania sp. SIO3B3]|nr:hypothetical protein [Okeania sp. SIO3B3]